MTDRVSAYASWLSNNRDKAGTPEFEKVAAAYKMLRQSPQAAQEPGKPLDERGWGQKILDFGKGLVDEPKNFVEGLADIGYGSFQLGANIGDSLRKALPDDLERSIYGNADYLGEGVNDFMRWRDEQIGGNSAERFAGNLLGGGALAKGAPGLLNAAKDGLAVAATMPTTNQDFYGEKGTQMLAGVLAGAGVEGVRKIIKLLPPAKAANARAWLVEALERGGKSVDDAQRALASNTDDLATAGQVLARGGQGRAVGSNEAIGLERLASKKADTLYRDRFAAQANRVKDKLRSAFGTEDDLASAISRRSAKTGPMYDDALNVEVVPDAELRKILKDPLIKKHIKAAKELLESEKGVKVKKMPTPEQASRFVHYIGRAMRDAIDNTGDGARLGPETKGATIAARRKLLDWLDEANPSYGAARGKFSELSRPIDKMNVGQDISNKALPALSDFGSFEKQSGRALAKALREGKKGIIKRQTGDGSKSLSKVVGEDGEKLLKELTKELADQHSYSSMGGGNALSAAREITGQSGWQPVGILERSVVIANALISRLGLATKENSMKYLSKAMLDPKKTAELLNMATGGERKAIEALRKSIIAGTPAVVSDRGNE